VCPDLLVGAGSCDDAAVYRTGPDSALVLTVDVFPPVVNDPYDYGCIVAANCLSDCWAMGGDPLAVLNVVMFPTGELDLDVLAAILQGGADTVRSAGAFVVGGHTMTDERVSYGMAVIGRVHPDRVITNAGARPGDVLLLTKALGVGAITNSIKPGAVSDEVVARAVAFMKEFNKRPSELMRKFGAHACTDVTGFGLAGHLANVTRESGVTAVVHTSELPVIEGAMELIEAGLASPMSFRNYRFLKDRVELGETLDPNMVDLVFDSETSGGLVIALERAAAEEMLAALREEGIRAAIVGEVFERREKEIYFE